MALTRTWLCVTQLSFHFTAKALIYASLSAILWRRFVAGSVVHARTSATSSCTLGPYTPFRVATINCERYMPWIVLFSLVCFWITFYTWNDIYTLFLIRRANRECSLGTTKRFRAEKLLYYFTKVISYLTAICQSKSLRCTNGALLVETKIINKLTAKVINCYENAILFNSIPPLGCFFFRFFFLLFCPALIFWGIPLPSTPSLF